MEIYEGLFQASSRKFGVSLEEAISVALDDASTFQADLNLPFLACKGRVVVSRLGLSDNNSGLRRDFVLSGENNGQTWDYVSSEIVDFDPLLGLSPEELYFGNFPRKPHWFDKLHAHLHLGMGLSVNDELKGASSDLYESLIIPERFGPILAFNAGKEVQMIYEVLEALENHMPFPTYVRTIEEDALIGEVLPPTHAVPSGYARLFLPKPNLNLGRDGTRHPLIDLRTLKALDGRVPFEQWSSLDKKLRFEFAGEAALRFRSAVPHLRMLQMLPAPQDKRRKTNEEADFAAELSVLEAKFQVQEQTLTDLSAQLTNTRYNFEFQSLELEEALKEIGRLEGSRAYLKSLLAEMKIYNPHDTGAAGDIWDIEPTSFGEILEAIQLTETLKFTGKFSFVGELDNQPNIGAGLTRAWNGLRALDSYAANKNGGKFQGGFFDYLLDESHSGFKVPFNYFAAKESESVKANPALYESRVFRVPEEVRPGGTAYMEAHLKVMTNHALAPRMHFLDDTSNTGQIWIGYLGPHLPL